MRVHEGAFESMDGRLLFERMWLPNGEAKARLVIVHGYAEHSGRYAHVGAYFSGRGYAVHALDLRGHGRAEGDRVLVRSFNEYLDDVDAFLRHVRAQDAGDTPLFLLGHSMGGAIVTLSVVTRRPALAGLIVSAGVLTPPTGIQRVLSAALRVFGRVAPRLRLTKLDSATVSRDPAVVAQYDADPLNYRGKIPAGTVAAMTRAVAVIVKRTPAITLPLLVLHGSADKLANPDGSRMLYERASSPDKMLKLYEGLYHEILNEPEQALVMGDIAFWLDSHVDALAESTRTSPPSRGITD